MNSPDEPSRAPTAAAPVTWTLLGATVVVWLAQELAGGSQNPEVLLDFGAKYGPLIAEGEWWRLVTPIFLHVGFFHLLTNGIGLLIFGGLVERTFGSRSYLAIYLIAGVFGNLASYLAGPTLGAGASGAVFGIIGAFGAYLLVNRTMLGSMGRQSLSAVLFIVAINIVFGLSASGIDNWAHLGGLASGFALGWWLSPRPRRDLGWAGGRDAGFCGGVTLYRASGKQLVMAAAVAATAILVVAFGIGRDYPYVDESGRSDLSEAIYRRLQQEQYKAAEALIQRAIMAEAAGDTLSLLYLLRALETEQRNQRVAIESACRALDSDLAGEGGRLARGVLDRLGGRC